MSRAGECGQARVVLSHDAGPNGGATVHRAVLVYDDHCEFCRGWASRFTRWDRQQAVELLPLSDERALRLTGKNRDQLERAMHVVASDGKVHVGATAVRELFRFVYWGVVPRVMFRVPGAMRLAERVYRAVAARRSRVGCAGQHCASVATHGGDTEILESDWGTANDR